MYSPDIILSGLKIGADTFQLNLYVTFISALFVTFVLFQVRRILEKPVLNACYDLPTSVAIDWKLIVGATLFGVGWGITGLCPGPNIVGLGIISWPIYWLNFLGMVIGFLGTRYLIVKWGK